jgi:hypothetical protein
VEQEPITLTPAKGAYRERQDEHAEHKMRINFAAIGESSAP